MRDPFGPATARDVIRAVFHALVALLFTAPMWVFAARLFVDAGTRLQAAERALWLAGLSSLIVWGVPATTVVLRWRQRIYRHPERDPSSLVRTYAHAQMAGVLLATPLLLWFAWSTFRWFF